FRQYQFRRTSGTKSTKATKAIESISVVPFVPVVRATFAARIVHMKKIISTSDAPAAIGPYSQAIRSGDFLFCSGQIPLDPKSGQMVSDDIAEQTERVLENLKAILDAAGASFAHV